MRLADAKPELERLLQAHGAGMESPDPKRIWSAYREFARVPFDAPVSTLRFMAGIEASSERDLYHIACGRQFADRVVSSLAGEPIEIWILEVDLIYEAEEDLIGCDVQRFADPRERAREFLARIEGLPMFPVGFGARCPLRYRIKTFGKPWEKKADPSPSSHPC